MSLVSYTELLNPLDITRSRVEAGPLFEKHRFAVPLPGESEAQEVFQRGADGGAMGLSPVGQALQDRVLPHALPQPPLHVLLLMDAQLSVHNPLPKWLETCLAQPEALYLVLPSDLALNALTGRPAKPDLGAGRHGPQNGATEALPGCTVVHVHDRERALRLLIESSHQAVALLADPDPALLSSTDAATPALPAQLFGDMARGQPVPFAGFHTAVCACRWLMTAHGQAPVTLSLYSPPPQHEELRALLDGQPWQILEGLEGLEKWPPPGDGAPPPYRLVRSDPPDVPLQQAARVVLQARGPLDDLLACDDLRDLVVDNSLWLDCASVSRLRQLRSLSLVGVKVADFDFLLPLQNLEELRLSRLPFAGQDELAKPAGLRTLEVLRTPLSSLSFASELDDLRHLRVDRLRDVNSSLWALAGHPGLHTIILPDPELETLDPLAMLPLRRFETWTSRVADVEALADQHRLQKLLLQNTRVRDISPLAGLRGLRELWLLACPLRDLSPLAGCAELRVLELQYVVDVDWRALAQLRGLQTLYLQHSSLSDVAPLSELRHLQRLDLRGTSARSLQPLTAMPALEELAIAYTPIRDITPALTLPGLRRLVLDPRQAASVTGVPEHVHLEVA